MERLTSVRDIEELVLAEEVDEVLHDRLLEKLTVQLHIHPISLQAIVNLCKKFTSATPLTFLLPMQARLAMRTFCGKPSDRRHTLHTVVYSRAEKGHTLDQRHLSQLLTIVGELLLDGL